MGVRTPVRLQRGFAEVVEREARAARAQGPETADELDAFIDEEAQQPERIRRLWIAAGTRECLEACADLKELEAEFRRMFEAALGALGYLREWAADLEQRTGHAVRNASVLEDAWQAVVELRTRILSELAWLNAPTHDLTDAQYEQAMADVHRGETVDVEDIIRALRYPAGNLALS